MRSLYKIRFTESIFKLTYFFILSLFLMPKDGSAKVEHSQLGQAQSEQPQDKTSNQAKNASTPFLGLPFIKDSYQTALELAKKSKKPIFIEVWAPWCHTCRFMKAYVFTDPSLEKIKDKAVWLELNADMPSNIPVLEKLAVSGIPVFFMIDPDSEFIIQKWVGSATVAQLEDFLERSIEGYNLKHQYDTVEKRSKSSMDQLTSFVNKILPDSAGKLKTNSTTPPKNDEIESLDKRLLESNTALSNNQFAQAAATLSQILVDSEGKNWKSRPHAIEQLITAISEQNQYKECAEVAQKYLKELKKSSHWANIAATGLQCSMEEDFESQPDWAKDAIAYLEPIVLQAASSSELFSDDRSSLYAILVELRQLRKQEQLAKDLAKTWQNFLEEESKKAPTPDARAVFDAHKLNSALVIGNVEKIIPSLEQSEKDLPSDYNPPSRLAIAYREIGKLNEALSAIDRAIQKANPQNTRIIRMYETKASIYQKKGDIASAQKTLETVLSFINTLPNSKQKDREKARITKSIEKLAK